MRNSKLTVFITIGLSSLALSACTPDTSTTTPPAMSETETAPAATVAEAAYPERAYFGDTHVHTGW